MKHANKFLFTALFSISISCFGQDDSLMVDDNGNIGIGTSSPTAAMHIKRSDGTARLLIEEDSTNTESVLYDLRNGGGVRFNFRNTDSGRIWSFFLRDDGQLAIGRPDIPGSEWRIDGSGNVFAKGTFNPGSSIETKTNFSPVDIRKILEVVAVLPLSEWSYKTDSNDVRHIGPMAEDFFKAFGIGIDSRHLSPNDMAGVNMASIQALANELEQKDKMITRLWNELEALKNELSRVVDVVHQIKEALYEVNRVAKLV